MTNGQTSTTHLTARFLRMLSLALEELDAVRDAFRRAEYAGLTLRAGALERETDALEREIEDACLRAFAGPLSPDALAFHLMVFRSLTNLERVGDYAFGVARDLEALAPVPAAPPCRTCCRWSTCWWRCWKSWRTRLRSATCRRPAR